ncbi:TPA: hypothetical protein PXO57_001610 [Yersinia enterocolitica]|uniref:Uncharacterized protein n=1 Tax=Yersinia intermedia TaxID=631 RepID=A0A0T9MUE0_YERIN|nr:Uncharacterised protein [Yersinia intermedia]HDL6593447.1 hypothetical protein [Yersinia enterocolitica]HDL6708923.1 hypothetical protein [Yersinia enterocolitica]HDL7591209.1 hypothetical protein [Yersinia enterocolitica]HDL7635112.1 hypothetical protein [Yersinia enterocolitica]
MSKQVQDVPPVIEWQSDDFVLQAFTLENDVRSPGNKTHDTGKDYLPQYISHLNSCRPRRHSYPQ